MLSLLASFISKYCFIIGDSSAKSSHPFVIGLVVLNVQWQILRMPPVKDFFYEQPPQVLQLPVQSTASAVSGSAP